MAAEAGYNRRAVEEGDRQRLILCAAECLARQSDAFCDGLPDPGCTCGGMERLAERHAAARIRDGIEPA